MNDRARQISAPLARWSSRIAIFSASLVLVGLAWLGSATGVVRLSLETVLATALVILGAGMVLTARTDWSLSRKHWPMWLGLAVLLLVLAGGSGAWLIQQQRGTALARQRETDQKALAILERAVALLQEGWQANDLARLYLGRWAGPGRLFQDGYCDTVAFGSIVRPRAEKVQVESASVTIYYLEMLKNSGS